MKISGAATALTGLSVVSTALGQMVNDPVDVTDKKTGIKFSSYAIPKDAIKNNGHFQLGMVVASTPGNEYIGNVIASKKGYSGISHSSGMTKALLLVFWADKDKVMHSFRYADDYVDPTVYTGRAKVTEMNTIVNATHFEFTYRCANCFSWNVGNTTAKTDTSGDIWPFGWVQASATPSPPGDINAKLEFHEQGFGTIPLDPALAKTAKYAEYAKMGAAPKGAAPKGAAPKGAAPKGAAPKGGKTGSAAATPAAGAKNRRQAPGLMSQPSTPKAASTAKSQRPDPPVLNPTAPAVPAVPGAAAGPKRVHQRRQINVSTVSSLPKITPSPTPPALGGNPPKVPVPTSSEGMAPAGPKRVHQRRQINASTVSSLPKITPSPTPPALGGNPPKVPVPTSSEGSPKAAKLWNQRRQVAGSSNSTVSELPKVATTVSPALEPNHPKIPIPTSTAKMPSPQSSKSAKNAR